MSSCKSKFGVMGCRAGVRCPDYASRFVPRDGELAEYYAATDVKHFNGTSVAGSKFTGSGVNCVEDVVRLLVSDGRDLFMDDDRTVFVEEHGCDVSAFFDGFRYLKVNTGGSVGVVRSEGFPSGTPVRVVRMKPNSPCSLVVEVSEQPPVAFGTVIMGDGEDGLPYVVTCFPGPPVQPAVDDRFDVFEGRKLTVGLVSEVLGVEGFWLNSELR